MDFSNVAHLHLLLNHVPTVATVVGIGLLLAAFARRSNHLMHASFEVLFLIALITVPVYMTGVAGKAQVQDQSGVTTDAVDAHEDAALVAFMAMQITGLIAWLGLWQFRRFSRPSQVTLTAVTVFSVVTLVLMARAANLGGEIHHPEIRVNADIVSPSVARGVFSAAFMASFVNDNVWVWPAAETLHFMGLCFVFGVLLVINLRVLGAMTTVSFAALHDLLPLAIVGFGVNLLTGMLFFIAAPEQYVDNSVFYWKIALISLAGVHVLYLTVFGETWMLKPGADASIREKCVALLGIGVWVGVIYAGRMLPFLGNAF